MTPGSQIREFRENWKFCALSLVLGTLRVGRETMGWAYLNTALHAEHDLNHFDTFKNSSTDVPGQNLPSH